VPGLAAAPAVTDKPVSGRLVLDRASRTCAGTAGAERRRMNNQALVVLDPVLARSNGTLIKGKLNVQLGRYELTANRLTFFGKSRAYMMFGLLGALLALLAKGKRALDLELSQITAIARGKYGLNKKILDVTMADGTVHRLGLDKFDDLSAQLRDQLARRGASVDVKLAV
jgi:hypothetical protein